MEFNHKPVLLNECIDGLNIRGGGIYVDGTLGGAGHSIEILKACNTARLIAIDKDEQAIEHSKQRLAGFSDRVTFVRDDFKNIQAILSGLNVSGIDGALLDLGVSSFQLDNFERGFSYRADDVRLDMRMDKRQTLSAYEVVNEYSHKELTGILYKFGEEKFAPRIANNIVRARETKPIETCGNLTEIIYASIPAAARRTGGNPAKRTFQALRIEVNGELDTLKDAVTAFTNSLNVSGRLCIITFHSLEDRIVKHTYRELATGCICPPRTPICICGNKPKVSLINNKPILASDSEQGENPRSASAKLRICEKL